MKQMADLKTDEDGRLRLLSAGARCGRHINPIYIFNVLASQIAYKSSYMRIVRRRRDNTFLRAISWFIGSGSAINVLPKSIGFIPLLPHTPSAEQVAVTRVACKYIMGIHVEQAKGLIHFRCRLLDCSATATMTQRRFSSRLTGRYTTRTCGK
jgi:hypothetical protein